MITVKFIEHGGCSIEKHYASLNQAPEYFMRQISLMANDVVYNSPKSIKHCPCCGIGLLIDLICDLCQISCYKNDDYCAEFGSLYADWGYGSLQDGTSEKATLCENCFASIRAKIQADGAKIRYDERMRFVS